MRTRAPTMEAISRMTNKDIVKVLQIIRKTLKEIDRDTLDKGFVARPVDALATGHE